MNRDVCGGSTIYLTKLITLDPDHLRPQLCVWCFGGDVTSEQSLRYFLSPSP